MAMTDAQLTEALEGETRERLIERIINQRALMNANGKELADRLATSERERIAALEVMVDQLTAALAAVHTKPIPNAELLDKVAHQVPLGDVLDALNLALTPVMRKYMGMARYYREMAHPVGAGRRFMQRPHEEREQFMPQKGSYTMVRIAGMAEADDDDQ